LANFLIEEKRTLLIPEFKNMEAKQLIISLLIAAAQMTQNKKIM
jgi:hypothetical protein